MFSSEEPNIFQDFGFVVVPRKIRQHWIWEDPVKLKWWLDILMEVNHQDKKINIGYQLIDCKRGQSINSLQTWAKRWRVDVGKVRRFFDLLKSDKLIDVEDLRKTTRLTICEYESYTGRQHANESQMNLKRISNESQVNTNKKGNKENKENIDVDLTDSFDDFWNLYDKKRGMIPKLRKKWQGLTDEERAKAMDHIPKYVASTPDKKYRQDPATYLNNKSFNDEIISDNDNKPAVLDDAEAYKQQRRAEEAKWR